MVKALALFGLMKYPVPLDQPVYPAVVTMDSTIPIVLTLKMLEYLVKDLVIF